MLAYERLNKNVLYSTRRRNTISDDTLAILVYHVRLLSQHVDDIVSDHGTINNDNIGFTETQINLFDSACKITETLNFFNINSNNNDDNFVLSLAYTYRNDVAILNKFSTNGVSIFSFKKHAFVNRVFSLMLVCRK